MFIFILEKIKQFLTLLNNKNIQLFVSGSAQGQKVAVHGNIEDYMTEPRLRLIAESKSFRPELFIEGIPFNGEVSFVSAIYGTLDDIRIGAQVNSKLVDEEGVNVKSAKVELAQTKAANDTKAITFFTFLENTNV